MPERTTSGLVFVAALAFTLGLDPTAHAQNLILDPSFEEPKEKDRFGRVFEKWGGWIYEGECEMRVSNVARTGKHSILVVGGHNPKIRTWPEPRLTLEPGRYRLTAYLRGLDIGVGPYNYTTEFQFAGKYINLKKNGTFGWSKITFVGEITEKKQIAHPSFGLMAPGYLWVDDVTLEKVGASVPLTPVPDIGPEEQQIAAPGRLSADPVRCPECGYRNTASWGGCYACGTALDAKKNTVTGPALKEITSFEGKSPFSGGKVVSEHATQGSKALRIDKSYAAMESPQSWQGYDYFKADVYTDAKSPVQLQVEIRDRQSKDYWTRVNYNTVVPPGASTLILPTALYVGEKSRPGRPLLTNEITRLVFAIGDKPEAPVFIDNIRLERDTDTAKFHFDGLWAFDLGPPGSPVMEGFTPLDVSKRYSPGRGFGWKDAKFWRVFNALQPDPLYQDFICVEKGGLAIDVPNGKYHVFVNMDSPSGYWGEFQRYRKRTLIVEGKRYQDTLDLQAFKERYYRFWDKEDLPADNTFDRYQVPYFNEKLVAADVRDGQLNIDFDGIDWSCCVSAIVVYPDAKAAEGQRFLDFVKERRRFHFDNAFKRVVRPTTGSAVPEGAKGAKGFVAFVRDWMDDVYLSDRPMPKEIAKELVGAAFAGEYEPVTVSVLPLRDLGRFTVSVSALKGPGSATIAASAIDVGHVQHRITRFTEEGSVYTITPKLIVPRGAVEAPKDVTRTFWLTVKTPADALPGVYQGEVRIAAAKGETLTLPLRFTVRKGKLDPVDVPAGPWGHTIDLPWYDNESGDWNRSLADKSLKRLRDYGFTTATGLPLLTLKGFKDKSPQIDFARGDAQMKLFKDNRFTMPVVTYCPFVGVNLYYKDETKMKAAGFADYSQYVAAVFGEVQKHADQAGWLPVYWNLADEPIGGDLPRSAENAEAFRKAFGKGPPFFTGASSFTGSDKKDPHFRLSKALHVANWNGHSDTSVKLLQADGGDWAFYNGANRWTYGVYMYKCAKEYNMKFRVAWHWNNVAGDPYYALDCREDDFAWCNSSPEGELIPSVLFERLREGLDDYRRMLTLARLAREKSGTPAARAADKLLAQILGGFRLGDRDLRSAPSFAELRSRLDAAIEALQ
ncbi:MAG: hypothetical protein L0Y72_26225 [Gemmataceae bacterium]|nr:hypothetical protein [Gemmataceae bacterium]